MPEKNPSVGLGLIMRRCSEASRKPNFNGKYLLRRSSWAYESCHDDEL